MIMSPSQSLHNCCSPHFSFLSVGPCTPPRYFKAIDHSIKATYLLGCSGVCKDLFNIEVLPKFSDWVSTNRETNERKYISPRDPLDKDISTHRQIHNDVYKSQHNLICLSLIPYPLGEDAGNATKKRRFGLQPLTAPSASVCQGGERGAHPVGISGLTKVGSLLQRQKEIIYVSENGRGEGITDLCGPACGFRFHREPSQDQCVLPQHLSISRTVSEMTWSAATYLWASL